METLFDALMEDLGKVLDTKLKPDHLNICRLKYPDGLIIQLEVDRDESRLVMGTPIGTLPPGRFRQDFLEQTLKANYSDYHLGTFGYAKKSGELYLYAYLLIKNLSGKQLATFLEPFNEKARSWAASLASNTVPTVSAAASSKKSSGMFGLAS